MIPLTSKKKEKPITHFSRFNRLYVYVSLGLVGIITLIALWFTLSLSTSNRRQVQALRNQESSLNHKYRAIKPAENAVTQGRFNLNRHEEQLAKQYHATLNQAYDSNQLPKDLYHQKAQLTRLLTANGYTQLREQLVGRNNNGQVVYLPSNGKVSITFTNFDVRQRTIEVISYITYQQKNDHQTHLTYFDTTYSFTRHQAFSTNITTTDVNNN